MRSEEFGILLPENFGDETTAEWNPVRQSSATSDGQLIAAVGVCTLAVDAGLCPEL
jgi:hypothetical protein